MLIDDVEALRRKLRTRQEPLASYVRSFMKMAERTDEFPRFSALAYVLTGEMRYAEAFREKFLPMVRSFWEKPFDSEYPAPWGNPARLGRSVPAYDWVVDSGVFSESEQGEIARILIDLMYTEPYFVSQARFPSANNQILSMCYGMVVIGYLFGVKRGDSVLARRLMDYGMRRFPDIIGRTMPGGYTLEGSTYHHQVSVPITILFCQLMEQITGQTLFATPFPPNGVSVQDIIASDFYITSPGGLLPPWDNYGYLRRFNGAALSYLSRRTGDPRPLAALRDLHVWQRNDSMAWGRDDRLWTLLFWPDEDPGEARDWARPWALEAVGAGLDHQETGTRLFQMWDRCGAREHVTRPQVNPNSILFEAYGTPFLQDGTPNDDCHEFDYAPSDYADVFTEEDIARNLQYYRACGKPMTVEQWIRSFGQGTLGASNSIILDGNRAYVPDEEKVGRLVQFGSVPALAAVCADAADFYRPRYDVHSMRRTSVLLDGRFVVTTDEVELGEPMDCDWQVFTRPGARADGDRTVVDTLERNRLTIVPAAGDGPHIHEVPGFPRWPEGRSSCVRYRQRGQSVRFGFLLWPQVGLEVAEELKTGWKLTRNDTGETLSEDCSPLDVFYLAAGAPGGTELTLSTEFQLDEPTGPLWLSIAECARCIRIKVNGRAIDVPHTGGSHDVRAAQLLPVVVDVSDAVRPGKNTVEIAAESVDGQVLDGPIALCTPREFGPVPQVRMVGPNTFEITGDGVNRTVLVNPLRKRIQAAGIETDAFVASLDERGFSVLNATVFEGSGWSLASDEPVSLSVADGRCTYAEGPRGCKARLSGPDGPITVELSGTYSDFSFKGPQSVAASALKLVSDEKPRPFAHPIELPEHEQLLVLALEKGRGAVPRLIEALHSRDWRAQAMAAEMLGIIGDERAVEPLIALLAEEDPSVIYTRERDWPDKTIPPRAARGFRVRQAVVAALGMLGDRRAVKPLCDLLERAEDYYTVHALAAKALGELGDASALPVLEKWLGPGEINARDFAREAVAKLRQTGR